VITTERLELRPLRTDDLDDLVSLHAEPEVIRFMQAADRATLITRLEADARQWRERGHGLLAVTDRVDGRFVGRTGLKYWEQFGETEVGWVLRRREWGHGFATEAARACAEWGFRNLPVPYLTAFIQPHNARSIAVAQRLGMTPLREDVLNEIPCVVYALSREDWAGHSSNDAAKVRYSEPDQHRSADSP
jgi:RimJ/RimL family protein N-acetyltransferase